MNKLTSIINFRKQLHKHPQLSGNEQKTALSIIDFIKPLNPDSIISELGKTGLAVIFKGKEAGKTLMFRADIDALPINETSNLDYQSIHKNTAHLCGHDGHTAILGGVAHYIANHKPLKGNIVLLFQPAEETGEGAKWIVSDPKFKDIEPDYIFGLHNLPGFPLHNIIIKEDTFTSASKGMIVKLFGKTSHAAEPEKGISPALALSEIIQGLTHLSSPPNSDNYILTTVVYAHLGEIAFGTSPGNAEIMVTLRTFENNSMKKLVQTASNIIKTISDNHNLTYSIEWSDEFIATVNDKDCVKIIKDAAKKNNLSIIEMLRPFKWSEDFGVYTKLYKGAFLGIGAGENHPSLHQSDYDFPDEIIENGVNLFCSIADTICGLEND